MLVAYSCVLIAAVLPYIWVGFAKFGTKGYTNNNPREFLEKLEGKAQRANHAHLNAFEAFGPFAAGVIIANLAGVPYLTINTLSVTFIIFRILHGLFYLQDRGSLRSLVWICGYACVITLFVLAIIK